MEIIVPEMSSVSGWVGVTIALMIAAFIASIYIAATWLEEGGDIVLLIGLVIAATVGRLSAWYTVSEFSKPQDSNLSNQLYDQANEIYNIPISKQQSKDLTTNSNL